MKVLLLVHRLPYPPNKGDKVRSYHLLRHLARQHEVYLGTFVDDPDDWQHVPEVRRLCVDVHAAGLKPSTAKLASLRGLLTGEALSLPYYRDAGLQAWVDSVRRQVGVDAVVVFSSTMAQYAATDGKAPVLVDFVDVDSAKWTDYAPEHRWPLSWLYRREGARLLAFERATAERATCSFFVTDNEVELFRKLTPGGSFPVQALCNGVDADYFSPDPAWPSPFAPGEQAVVFTGAMDYWPNVDAVTWFVQDMLPLLRQQHPTLRFYIVGRSPTPAVKALASEAVVVTGTVPDVRPYLQHGAAIVAPLRLARGIQNKVLEAMAMAKPVVAAESCVRAIATLPQTGLCAAVEPQAYVQAVLGWLADPKAAAVEGASARQFVLDAYSWDSHLAGLDRFLGAAA